MLYRIADLAVDARSGHTRVEVEFWTRKADYQAGKPATVVNDFYNNYRHRQEQITDSFGRIRVGGVWVPPWVEQAGQWVRRSDGDRQDVPIPQMIHEDLLRWWHGVGSAKRADRRDHGFVKASADPLGVMARPDVKGMIGRVWTDEE